MKIRNWETYQHYKHRSPPWIKLHRGLLDDMEYHALEPAAAKMLTLLWLLASENEGTLPDTDKIAFRLRVAKQQVERAILQLSHWIEHDASGTLAPCKQHAILEKSRERVEGEGEKEARVRAVFVKPTPEQVSEYAGSINAGIDGQEFVDFYESKGWRVGSAAMKDWQAAVRTWARRRTNPQPVSAANNGGFVSSIPQKVDPKFKDLEE